MNKRFTVRHSLTALTLLVASAGFSPAQAQVSTCNALTLYGNAANSGLCTSLSPATQNLLVCELANDPDIHATFNDKTALHVTVREHGGNQRCEGKSDLAGTWPAGLRIAPGQPNTVCNVGIQHWVDQLKGVNEVQPGGSQSFCSAAFIAAGNDGHITQQQVTNYKKLCTRHKCP